MGISGAAEAPDPSLLGPQLVVAGFSTHVEILRAHEIANEVRRVKKQLKDCQQLAMLYNNRERIFGLPITNVGLPALAHCPPSPRKAQGEARGLCGHLWNQPPAGRALPFGGGRNEQAAEMSFPTLWSPGRGGWLDPQQKAGGSAQTWLSHSEPRCGGRKKGGQA